MCVGKWSRGPHMHAFAKEPCTSACATPANRVLHPHWYALISSCDCGPGKLWMSIKGLVSLQDRQVGCAGRYPDTHSMEDRPPLGRFSERGIGLFQRLIEPFHAACGLRPRQVVFVWFHYTIMPTWRLQATSRMNCLDQFISMLKIPAWMSSMHILPSSIVNKILTDLCFNSESWDPAKCVFKTTF